MLDKQSIISREEHIEFRDKQGSDYAFSFPLVIFYLPFRNRFAATLERKL